MRILRNVLGVICGYAIFVISALLLFRFAEIDAHAQPTTGIIVLVIGYGIVFSFLGGLLAQTIARQRTLTVNYSLAVVIAGFALFSLLKTSGNHYSQFAAIFCFAPASIAGGVLLLRKQQRP